MRRHSVAQAPLLLADGAAEQAAAEQEAQAAAEQVDAEPAAIAEQAAVEEKAAQARAEAEAEAEAVAVAVAVAEAVAAACSDGGLVLVKSTCSIYLEMAFRSLAVSAASSTGSCATHCGFALKLRR